MQKYIDIDIDSSILRTNTWRLEQVIPNNMDLLHQIERKLFTGGE